MTVKELIDILQTKPGDWEVVGPTDCQINEVEDIEVSYDIDSVADNAESERHWYPAVCIR